MSWTIETLKEHFEALRKDDQEALKTALVAAEKRLDLLNELRQGVATTDQLEALEKVVDDLKTRMNLRDGKGSGVSQSWGVFVAIVTIVLSLLYFIFRSKP